MFNQRGQLITGCAKIFDFMSRRRVTKKLGGQHDFSPNYHGQELSSLGGYLPDRGLDKPLTNGSTGGIFNPPVTGSGNGNGNGTLPGYNVSDDPLNGNSSWSDILQGVSKDDFADLLSSLGVDYGKGMDDASKANWAQALLNAMLKHYQDQEQRSYDKSVRDEQRIYDSPTNQLARLMGAGISRDAAIQMLSGGSEAALVGSASAGTEGAGSPAEASAATLQSKLGIANAVFNGLGTIISFVSAGAGLSQAIQSTKMLQFQNTLNSQFLTGLNSADKIMSVLSNGVKSGAITSEQLNKCSNAQDGLKLIASTPALSSAVDPEAYKNVTGTTIGSEAFNRAWSAHRNQRDAGHLLDTFIDQQDANLKLTNLTTEKVGAEIESLVSSTALSDQQLLTEIENTKNAYAQRGLIEQQTDFVASQTAGQNLSNDLQQQTMMFTIERVNNENKKLVQKLLAEEDTMTMSDEGEPISYRELTIRNYLKNEDHRQSALELQCVYDNASSGFAAKYPTLWFIAEQFNKYHVADYLP